MKERGILMGTDMVKAVLEGRKTQTRRPMKPQPYQPRKDFYRIRYYERGDIALDTIFDPVEQSKLTYGSWAAGAGCPFGQVGDRLYVRETWAEVYDINNNGYPNIPHLPTTEEEDAYTLSYIVYKASIGNWHWLDEDGFETDKTNWKPSIHMPKKYARIWLEITDIRVERVQDISEDDAIDEGCSLYGPFNEYKGASKNKPNDCMKLNAFSTAKRAFQDIWESCGYRWDGSPWVWVIEFKVIDK